MATNLNCYSFWFAYTPYFRRPRLKKWSTMGRCQAEEYTKIHKTTLDQRLQSKIEMLYKTAIFSNLCFVFTCCHFWPFVISIRFNLTNRQARKNSELSKKYIGENQRKISNRMKYHQRQTRPHHAASEVSYWGRKLPKLRLLCPETGPCGDPGWNRGQPESGPGVNCATHPSHSCCWDAYSKVSAFLTSQQRAITRACSKTRRIIFVFNFSAAAAAAAAMMGQPAAAGLAAAAAAASNPFLASPFGMLGAAPRFSWQGIDLLGNFSFITVYFFQNLPLISFLGLQPGSNSSQAQPPQHQPQPQSHLPTSIDAAINPGLLQLQQQQIVNQLQQLQQQQFLSTHLQQGKFTLKSCEKLVIV